MGRAIPRRINARLDEPLARRVAALQKKTGRSLTSLVQESLEAHCERAEARPESAHEIFTRLGFIGMVRGPREASANVRKYVTEYIEQKLARRRKAPKK